MTSVPGWVSISIGALAVINFALVISVIMLFSNSGGSSGGPSISSSASNVYISSSSEPASGYILGGALNEGVGQWVNKKPLAVARSDLQAVNCGGKVYLLGGLDGSENVLKTVVEYDPVFETETVKADMINPRYRFAAACLDNKVYVMGGFNSTADLPPMSYAEVYDIDTNTWASITDTSTNRGDTTAVGVDGKVYLMFGYTTNYDFAPSVEVYDPVAKTWTEKTSSTATKRGDVSCALAPDNKHIVVAGGWGEGSDHVYDFVHDVELYNIATDSWKTVAPIPAPRGDMSVVTYNGKIHVIGGEIWSGEMAPCPWDPSQQCGVNEIPTHDHFVFDMENNVWTKGAPIPTARFRFSTVSVNGAIFAFGGHSEGKRVVADVEAFYDVGFSNLYYFVKSNVEVEDEASRLRA